ncbi:PIR protein [Plasmodium ovale]|uniref:PIR Superfamily Protein n=2 Tax=Plasmodium ovale TaxID=36330 RepID=A0A1A8X8C1_PLAOA|nr:PIR Superfamily Protein [Plasmodium ovale curtisi]SBT00055.1 PIR Superfamily Protein [Plasmodium ovale curtisi]SBT84778.1 PIR protein [Plasmodium ovale]
MEHEDFPETFLKGSSNYKLYDELDKHEERNRTCEHCKLVETVLSRYDKSFNDLCCIFEKNLISLNTTLKGEKHNNERCKYFNFWIHDKIKKRISATIKDASKGNHIRLQFLQVYSLIEVKSLHSDCHFEYNSKIDLNLWKRWKDLYDFIKNYDSIKDLVNSNSELCKKYPTYLSYIQDIYKNYKTECCNNNGTKCPFTSGFDDWCNNNEFLNSLTCNATDDVAGSFREEVMSPYSMKEQKSSVPPLAADSQPGSGYNHPDEILTDKSDYYIKLAAGFSLLGIFSTAFFLYKFTTFGTWIRSKVLNKKINANIDEDAQNLMAHELNNEDENFYNNGYNIIYHSS